MFWDMRAWRKLPFSYKKFVIECQIVFFIVSFPGITFFLANKDVPFAGVIALCISMFLVLLMGKVLLGPVWRRASQEFKDTVPFDADQTTRESGSISSASQLIAWMFGKIR